MIDPKRAEYIADLQRMAREHTWSATNDGLELAARLVDGVMAGSISEWTKAGFESLSIADVKALGDLLSASIRDLKGGGS